MDLESVFDILKKDKTISKDKILELIDEEALEYLLDENILKNTDNSTDLYEIDNIEEAFYLGRHYVKEKDFLTANAIFDCCYKLEPNNYLVNYQLFYRSLFSHKSKIIFRHFNVVYPFLMKNGRENDASFYLLLLGYLYDIPKEYKYLKEDFKNIELKDILLDESDRYFDIDRNDMRTYVYEKKYYKVSKSIDILFDRKNLDFEDTLEKELLLEIMFNHRSINVNIDKYLKENNLDELTKYLTTQHNRRNLQISTEYLYVVLNKYNEIKNTNIVPQVTANNFEDTFEAIDNNDFYKAFNLLKEYNLEKNITTESPLYIILKNIVSLIDKINGNNIKKEPIKEDIEKKEISISDKNMIDEKVKAIRNGRVLVLLDPMEKERRNLINSYLRDFDDIVSFSVGEGPERRVAIRYKSNINERIDPKEIYKEINELIHEEHNYKEALKRYRILLSIGKPMVINYAGCGLTLLKLKREKEAIDCFRIATMLSKEYKLNHDYSDIIESILDKNKCEDEKETVDMKLSDFNDNKDIELENGFINDLIGLMNEKEITLEEACAKLNLNEEQINYVKLLCARDYFYLNDNKKGEQLLKEVNKSKAKNPEIKKLVNEINLSKKYYSNRLDNERSQLVFKKK